MPIGKALIIDDEEDLRELFKETLARMDLVVYDAKDVTSAMALLKQHSFKVCLTDMRLPDGEGMAIVDFIQQNYPQVPVAVITAYGNMDLAITALKKGAFDFVSKPVDLAVLRKLVNTALRLSSPGPQIKEVSTHKLLGKSPAILELRSSIAKLARSQAPIFISGESGVGKELVARLIHEQGPRSAAAFVPVNCGAIPADLMESEFFGHKRGSFTGAMSDKDGLFQAANEGTLFLDEVADLPLAMQVKLLRAIQEKAVRRIGDQRECAVDTRILSATHQNLQQLVNDGKFRQDLFFRINVIELKVPRLADRQEDIPILADYFLTRLSQNQQLTKPELTQEAISRLKSYRFPGNIRELENILERAFTLCENYKILAQDLHLDQFEKSVFPEREENLTSSTVITQKSSDAALDSYLDELERAQIVEALKKTRWNKTAAAKLLGISFRALRYRLKKYSIE